MVHTQALTTQRAVVRKLGTMVLEEVHVSSREEALYLVGRMRSDRSDESLVVVTKEVFQ